MSEPAGTRLTDRAPSGCVASVPVSVYTASSSDGLYWYSVIPDRTAKSNTETVAVKVCPQETGATAGRTVRGFRNVAAAKRWISHHSEISDDGQYPLLRLTRSLFHWSEKEPGMAPLSLIEAAHLAESA